MIKPVWQNVHRWNLRNGVYVYSSLKKCFRKSNIFISIHFSSLFFIFSSIPMFTSLLFQWTWQSAMSFRPSSRRCFEKRYKLHTDLESWRLYHSIHVFLPRRILAYLFKTCTVYFSKVLSFSSSRSKMFSIKIILNSLYFYCHC